MPIRLVCFVLSLASLSGFSQELPPIQNFKPIDYQAGNQNWSIAQDGNELIYVANNEGLLSFNGSNWKLYPTPNETIIRSVKVVDDLIYTGCYMEFGYWQKDSKNQLSYTSLTDKFNIEHLEDEEFWKIIDYGDSILFQSLNRIYFYDLKRDTIGLLRDDRPIIKSFKVGNTIYYQQRNSGLYQINGEEDLMISDQQFLLDDEIVNLFSDSDGLIVLTQNSGFHRQQNNQLVPLKDATDDYTSISIYSAAKLKDGRFIIGSISNGLIVLNKDLSASLQINQQIGLGNNTILDLFEDEKGNIWTALDNGVSYINLNSSIQVFSDQTGEIGSIYAAAAHDGILYLGTNQGLFYRRLDTDDKFKFVEGTQGQVWFLGVLDNKLFCGHHTGTFKIERNKIERIANIQGTWQIRQLEDNKWLQGNYDGLYVMTNDKSQWNVSKIEGFDNSARHFEFQNQKIFVNHEYKGVFILDVDANFSKVENATVIRELKGANSSISKSQDKILYASTHGIYAYNQELKLFQKQNQFNSLFEGNQYQSGRIIPDSKDVGFWMFTKNSINRLQWDDAETLTIPISNDLRKEVVEYENLISLNDEDYLVGTSEGYLIIQTNNLTLPDFEVAIDNINLGINQDHSIASQLIDPNEEREFHANANSLRFNFYAPLYSKYFNPMYQFQLVGEYEDWSKWSTQSTVFFENLPPGKYQFKVRAKAGNKVSNNIATYEFRINKPWYFTNLMITIYGLAVIAFSIFMHIVYRRHYHKKQHRIVEENRRELEMTKMQNEKEIMKIRNEQLEEQYKNKTNELAASTMSIINKNELLSQIKDQLLKVEDHSDIFSVVKNIDKSLNHDENWKLFREAFENVDTEFFKNLKDQHPNLSPNDLKLCAYLRLNFSSKEISSLINISPRSVEVKRYRLRKKLNLQNSENLTDYIINI